MQNPMDILGNPKTRGEFRQKMQDSNSESANRVVQGEIPSDHPLWDVWDAIRGHYPSVTANWDSEPPMSWLAVLGGLTAEQLGNGVQNLCNHVDNRGNASFPPNAGEFKNLCLNNFGWEHSRQAKTLEEIRDTPILNLGESINVLDTPEGMEASAIGTPATNPNYFADLMKVKV